ncbi:DUF3105 domain-containing protein [soil metagenome]
MAVPPKQSQKELRDARRAEKVAEFQRKQAADRRKRVLGFSIGGVAVLAVIALVVSVIVINAKPKVDPASISISGLKTWSDLAQTHVATTVDYQGTLGMNPPAGGPHNQVWLNCGIYTQPQVNENAVHPLEHGAVWVTYDASKVTGAALTKLQGEMPGTYSILSPYVGLPAPIVASAWGAQVQLKSASDPRLQQFIAKYWKSASAPEPGAPCTGGIDGPGKIS